jgi:hypothetical protein
VTILQALPLGAADSDTRTIRHRPLSCEPHTMPPRRERQPTQPVEDATRAVEEALEREEVEVESVAQRLKRRRAELREKRQLESIQEIDDELAGGSRASSRALTGEEPTIVSHKRSASVELSSSSKRAYAPPVYEGTSLRELRDTCASPA